MLSVDLLVHILLWMLYFNVLIERFDFCCCYKGLCPDWPNLNPADKAKNAKAPMDLAEKWLDIPQVRSSHNR